MAKLSAHRDQPAGRRRKKVKEERKERSKSEEEKAMFSPRLRLSAHGQSHGLKSRKMLPWSVTCKPAGAWATWGCSASSVCGAISPLNPEALLRPTCKVALRGLPIPQGQVYPGKRPAVSTSLFHTLSPSPSSAKPRISLPWEVGWLNAATAGHFRSPKMDSWGHSTAHISPRPVSLHLSCHSEPVQG